MWTVPDIPTEILSGELASTYGGTLYRSTIMTIMNERLRHGVAVVEPDERDFSSTIVQAHRRGEKAVHVRAFRGSKDGKSSNCCFVKPTS